MRAAVVFCVLALFMLVQAVQSGPLGRAIEAAEEEYAERQAARDQQDREEQAEREADDASERLLRDCLNDPSWRKDAKAEQLTRTLAALQAIQKRRYGLVLTTGLPDLTPQLLEDIRKWNSPTKQPTESMRALIKNALLSKYGESELAKIALGWQKAGGEPENGTKGRFTWQQLVDELVAEPLGEVAAVAAKPLLPADAAVIEPMKSYAPTSALPRLATSRENELLPSLIPTRLRKPTRAASLAGPAMSCSTYLGRLSVNEYDPDSISNSFGTYGNPYGNTITNCYGIYGSNYSLSSWSNTSALDPPRIYADDGTYLGKLSLNSYDPDSISNPFGRFGSRYGNNLMNPFSSYGSRFSTQSWRNPYATAAPRVYGLSH